MPIDHSKPSHTSLLLPVVISGGRGYGKRVLDNGNVPSKKKDRISISAMTTLWASLGLALHRYKPRLFSSDHVQKTSDWINLSSHAGVTCDVDKSPSTRIGDRLRFNVRIYWINKFPRYVKVSRFPFCPNRGVCWLICPPLHSVIVIVTDWHGNGTQGLFSQADSRAQGPVYIVLLILVRFISRWLLLRLSFSFLFSEKSFGETAEVTTTIRSLTR